MVILESGRGLCQSFFRGEDIFFLDREGPLGTAKGTQHLFHFRTKVEMEMGGMMFVDDEAGFHNGFRNNGR
jgi:hypothetical protein